MAGIFRKLKQSLGGRDEGSDSSENSDSSSPSAPVKRGGSAVPGVTPPEARAAQKAAT